MNKMFRTITKTLFAAVAATLMAGCSSDNNDTTQALTVQVKVVMPEEVTNGTAYAGHTVTLGKYAATTDAQGVATFENVIPDVYDIATSADISIADYKTLTGKDASGEGFMISGSLLKQTVGSSATITLKTVFSVKESIVISKVYYAGTKDNNNKNYVAAQYIELFNNSDKAVDASGLYLGMVESESTPAYTLGSTPGYIYLKQIYQIPAGTPKEVPAGGSILITNSAIDHTDNNDVDLSGADYEAKDASGKTTNNPATPALTLVYSYLSSISKINFMAGGASSIVLFRTDEDVKSWEKVYKDGASKGNMFVKAPAQYVIDGVECLKMKTTGVDVASKRLYDYIDAGYTHIEAISGYNGQVAYRKKGTSATERTVLADTNNSSNDFAVSADIKPREYK